MRRDASKTSVWFKEGDRPGCSTLVLILGLRGLTLVQCESGARAWTTSCAPGTQLCVSLGTVQSRQGVEVGEQAGPRKQEESGSQEAVRHEEPKQKELTASPELLLLFYL